MFLMHHCPQVCLSKTILPTIHVTIRRRGSEICVHSWCVIGKERCVTISSRPLHVLKPILIYGPGVGYHHCFKQSLLRSFGIHFVPPDLGTQFCFNLGKHFYLHFARQLCLNLAKHYIDLNFGGKSVCYNLGRRLLPPVFRQTIYVPKSQPVVALPEVCQTRWRRLFLRRLRCALRRAVWETCLFYRAF